MPHKPTCAAAPTLFVRAVSQILYVFVALVVSAALFFPSRGLAAQNPQLDQLSAEAQSVVDSINQVRANYNLTPLLLNSYLMQTAQGHVDDMMTNGNYGHIGSDGSTVGMRVARSGYGAGNSASENWVSVNTPDQAITWWMNSYPHRANILSQNWKELGIGMRIHPYNGLYYFVVVFAVKADGSSPHTPSVAPQIEAVSAEQAPVETVQAAAQVTIANGIYMVQSGDTLSTIATRFNTSWQTLASVNALGENSYLQIGQQIRLPGGIGGPVSDDIAPVVVAASPKNVGGYTIQPGDTLSVVAQLYDTTWERLAELNNFQRNTVLQVGKIIKVPLRVEEPETANQPTTAAAHTVQPGETVIQIALQYNLDWQALLRNNGLSESTILSVGQVLQLR